MSEKRAIRAIFAVLFLLSAFTVFAEGITKTIAMVNGKPITSKDLNDYCNVIAYKLSNDRNNDICRDESFRNEALDKLIEDKLVVDQAKRANIIVPESVIDAKLNQMISSYPSREEFEKSLIDKGFNITLLKDRIEEQFLMQTVIEAHVNMLVSVSPQDINRYYTENKELFFSPRLYTFYIIKSKDENLIRKISKLIRDKGIFAAEVEYGNMLVKVESGDNELKDEMLEIISALKEEEHDIKKMEDFFHLIYLISVSEPYLMPLEEVKEKVYAYSWDEKFKKRFREWISSLKEKAVIKRYDE